MRGAVARHETPDDELSNAPTIDQGKAVLKTDVAERLTVAVVSCDEGALLSDCLERAAPWADEVLVLDMESSDDTKDVAARHGAEVVSVRRVPVVERIRQVALDRARTDWVVFLDPDEWATPETGQQCRLAIDQYPDAAAFRWPFCDTFFGEPLSVSRAGARKIVMAHRGRVRFRELQRAHEEPDCVGAIIDLEGSDATPILHHTFRSVAQIAEKLTRYAATGNPVVHEGLDNSDLLLLRLWLRHTVRQRAWRDGRAGMEAASLSALHDYLASLRRWEESGALPHLVRPGTRILLAGANASAGAVQRLRRTLKRSSG